MRAEWHKKRRLKDPGKLPKEPEEREIERSQNLIAAVLGPEEVAKLEEGADRQEKERARLAAYREKNREKLAEKARERRARK